MYRSCLFLAAACLAIPARAQITVTHADLEAALSIEGTNTLYTTESSAQLDALAAQTGANQTWDFNGLVYDPPILTEVERVQPPVPGSDDPHLAQATHIFRVTSSDSTVYTFQTLNATQAGFLGLSGPSVLVRFLPVRIDAVVPFTFGSTWGSTYETQFVPGFPPGVTMMVSEATNVVGWGTLMTPAGNSPALMIRTETTNTLSFPPLPPIVTTSSQILFTAYGMLNANIFITGGVPTSGDYNVYDPDSANEPPPGGNAVTLDMEGMLPIPGGQSIRMVYFLSTPATARIDVFDALGREIGIALEDQSRPMGTHRVVWSSPSIAPGVYVARLTADGHTATRTFTVVR